MKSNNKLLSVAHASYINAIHTRIGKLREISKCIKINFAKKNRIDNINRSYCFSKKVMLRIMKNQDLDQIYEDYCYLMSAKGMSASKKNVFAECQCIQMIDLMYSQEKFPYNMIYIADIPWHLSLWFTCLSGINYGRDFRRHEKVITCLGNHEEHSLWFPSHKTLHIIAEGGWSTMVFAQKLELMTKKSEHRHNVRLLIAAEIIMRLLAAHCYLSPIADKLNRFSKSITNDNIYENNEAMIVIGYLHSVASCWWNPFRLILLIQWLTGSKDNHLSNYNESKETPINAAKIFRSASYFFKDIEYLRIQLKSDKYFEIEKTLYDIIKHADALVVFDYSVAWCAKNLPQVFSPPTIG